MLGLALGTGEGAAVTLERSVVCTGRAIPKPSPYLPSFEVTVLMEDADRSFVATGRELLDSATSVSCCCSVISDCRSVRDKKAVVSLG